LRSIEIFVTVIIVINRKLA